MMTRILTALAFILLFCTCGEETKTEDKRKVFNYNEIAGISSLDPASASSTENIWAINQLFNGLVQTDDQLNVVPAIAKKFSISKDGLTYTFILRNDVYFHDNPCFENNKGRRVTARDAEYSFNRLYDSRVSSALSLLNNIDRTEKTNFKGFAALNDSVFQIYLKKPFSAFLNMLTMKYFSIVPEEAVEKYKLDFRRNPVGTGPFQFKYWEEGNKLIMTRNNRYFEKDEQNNSLPYLDAVTVSFIKDRETSFMELLNGKFDMLSGADAMNINEVLDKNGELRDVYAKKFILQKQTYLKTDYIGILIDEKIDIVKQSPLRLKAIRQAINYGFDRSKMIKFLRNNIGTAAQAGFIPKGMKSFDETVVKGYTYDPDKVSKLLEEAGYPGGKGLPEITLHTTENFKEQLEFIQSQLAENNIKVAISIEKPAVLRQAVVSCQYTMFKKSWVADYADEENFFSLFYSPNFAPEGFNYFHYKNEAFDAAFDKALQEQDIPAKLKLYQQMDQMLINDAPVIPLFYDQVIRLVHKNVGGLTTNAMNLLDLRRVKK
ncbi:MAG: ABC transporter substrate-binding protein [Sediminibacterium sp.]|nr:ABC transporter substrate-binding protein [Sediminibacterium sp.]